MEFGNRMWQTNKNNDSWLLENGSLITIDHSGTADPVRCSRIFPQTLEHDELIKLYSGDITHDT